MRIASLLPSATEIVCALGLDDALVAVTHECDHPPSVRGKPVVTSSVLGGGRASAEIDRHIRRLVHEGSSIYRLRADRLAELRPDLVLTQELCAVCAVSYPLVESAARRMDVGPQVVSLEPQTLGDVLENIRLVGRLADQSEKAEAVVAELQSRLDRVARTLKGGRPRRVVCLEWIDPLYSCGHWTPELVGMAGGVELLGIAGKPARVLQWTEIQEADPEVVVVMACGFHLERSLAETATLAEHPGWNRLTAVRSGEVHVVDGNAYFSRPGPRLVDSVEIMAGILHPELMPPAPDEVVRRYPTRGGDHHERSQASSPAAQAAREANSDR